MKYITNVLDIYSSPLHTGGTMAMDQFPGQNSPAEPHESARPAAAKNPAEQLLSSLSPTIECFNNNEYLETLAHDFCRHPDELLIKPPSLVNGQIAVSSIVKTRIERVCSKVFTDPTEFEVRATGLHDMFRLGFAAAERLLAFEKSDNADDGEVLAAQYIEWRKAVHDQDACVEQIATGLQIAGAPLVAWHLFEAGVHNALGRINITRDYDGGARTFVQPAANRDSTYWRTEGVMAGLHMVRGHRVEKEFTSTVPVFSDWLEQHGR